MSDSMTVNGNGAGSGEWDAVIVGASLAGCTAAIMLGRAGARVALVDQRTEPSAFKRICSHYIQASAVATLERLLEVVGARRPQHVEQAENREGAAREADRLCRGLCVACLRYRVDTHGSLCIVPHVLRAVLL